MVSINLPWPPSILSPNNRDHWTKKSTVKSEYRKSCGEVAKETRPLIPDGNIHIRLVFYPPTRRHYDMDNLLACMKSGIDGVCDAWGINDVRFRPITIDIGDVVKGGEVHLSVMNMN